MLIALILAGCGKDGGGEPSLVGAWAANGDNVVTDSMTFSYTGRYVFTTATEVSYQTQPGDYFSWEGTYTTTSGNITFSYDYEIAGETRHSTFTCTKSLAGNVLTLNCGGPNLVHYKQ